MNSHLVAVKVRVECGAYERMQFDSTAFNKHGFKRLNAEAVQRRRAVEHDRVIFNDNLEHIPYLGADAFHHALCALNVMGKAIFHELLHHEGFK